eukprot:scaffold117037_cov15-Prasinocladus_malaysianus.AAC.1
MWLAGMTTFEFGQCKIGTECMKAPALFATDQWMIGMTSALHRNGACQGIRKAIRADEPRHIGIVAAMQENHRATTDAVGSP